MRATGARVLTGGSSLLLTDALRRRDLYVYRRLHRRQPIANVNCCQPRERPANRPQDQIPERAGPEAGEQE